MTAAAGREPEDAAPDQEAASTPSTSSGSGARRLDEALPCPELFEAWLGGGIRDVELRPGEDLPVPDDAASVEAAWLFRDVLGRFASGVTVVTALHDGQPVGLTCQSFSSVSLDPPLVLFVPAHTSRAWPLIRETGSFCVNLLAADQAWVANTMASRGADKFAETAWQPSPTTGSPVLPGTLGFVDCTIHDVHEAGDHDVVIGRVLDLAATTHRDPLLFYRGRYRTTG